MVAFVSSVLKSVIYKAVRDGIKYEISICFDVLTQYFDKCGTTLAGIMTLFPRLTTPDYLLSA